MVNIKDKKNKTILIVDDEKDDLESMSQILSMNGYSVLKCNNSTEAFETLSENEIDLIIMDVMLPALTGDSLSKIFKEKLAKNTPIILVSIKPEIEVDTSEVDGFIQKPFNPISLVQQVNQMFKEYIV